MIRIPLLFRLSLALLTLIPPVCVAQDAADVLKRAAEGRQIIVFGHERRLIEWAENNIDNDHIVRLGAPSVSTRFV